MGVRATVFSTLVAMPRTIPIRGMAPIQKPDKVVSRQSIHKVVAEGDELDGVWDSDMQVFEWSGSLPEGLTLDVAIVHTVPEV